MKQDTIAAIATAPGEAGIAIVRISGPNTYQVADAVFRGPGTPPSRRRAFTFAHGHVVDAAGGHIDEVLMLFMRAPHSYTGEDQVEIQGHGGSVSCQRILRRVLDAGARLADPGEFTQRAFLNGRMDLVQAEAVLDLIKARSERAAKAAVKQLDGSISDSLSNLYTNCMSAHADLEATMDFPEDELPEAVLDDIIRRLDGVKKDTDALLSTWHDGRMLREGALIVIAGRPNAGKSTMMNALLGQDRAIVSDIPGTTRDTIEEGYLLNGIPLRLVDTAGIRESDSEIEREGIRRSRAQLEQADAVLYLIDSSTGITQADENNLADIDPKKVLVVFNKIDLPGERKTNKALPGHFEFVEVSLRDRQHISKIRDSIAKLLGANYRQGADQQAVISERHRQILMAFKAELETAAELVISKKENHISLASSHLRESLECLGTAVGKTYHHELLNSIFSRFCIGK